MARRRRDDTALVQLKTRMREPLRARLEETAKARGVSINAEIVDRLERSMDRQDLLSEVLGLAYGRKLADVFIALGVVMNQAGYRNRLLRGPKKVSSDPILDWTCDPIAYGEAVRAALRVLEAARPDQPIGNETRLASEDEKSHSFRSRLVAFGLNTGPPTIDIDEIVRRIQDKPLQLGAISSQRDRKS